MFLSTHCTLHLQNAKHPIKIFSIYIGIANIKQFDNIIRYNIIQLFLSLLTKHQTIFYFKGTCFYSYILYALMI